METKLLFVRHGQSVANIENEWGGHCDYDLTETGEKQAEIMARFLNEKYKCDAVFSSDLIRAQKTATAIAKPLGLTVKCDNRLREIYGGLWDGMTFDFIAENYEKEFLLWQKDMSMVHPPQGESVYDLQERAMQAVREIAENNYGKTVAVVAHRVIFRTLQCVWQNIPLSDINKCEWLANCSVSEVLYKDGKLLPVAVGQADFMGEYVTQSHGKM